MNNAKEMIKILFPQAGAKEIDELTRLINEIVIGVKMYKKLIGK